MKKGSYVKGKLTEWNKNTFGFLKVNKNKLCNELQYIDGCIEEEDGWNGEISHKSREVMTNLERTLKAKDWHQQAKYKWIREGDGITSFFHKIANGRK